MNSVVFELSSRNRRGWCLVWVGSTNQFVQTALGIMASQSDRDVRPGCDELGKAAKEGFTTTDVAASINFVLTQVSQCQDGASKSSDLYSVGDLAHLAVTDGIRFSDEQDRYPRGDY